MKNIIAVTRFNYETWREQCNYRDENKLYYYNTPNKITDNVPLDTLMIVLEMHNDENKIKGISLVKNRYLQLKERTKIYTHQNYNRYTYSCLKRIDRDELNNYDKNILGFFDIICFGGAKHLKRGKGIQRIPNDIIDKCKNIIYFPDYFIHIFKTKFVDLNI
jgi:hypothetical protein